MSLPTLPVMLTLCLGVAGLGCKSSKSAPPSEQPPKPEAQAVQDAPKPKPAQPRLVSTALTGTVETATLSVLEARGEDECRWVRMTPPDRRETVATLPVRCTQAELAWSPDGRHGLLFSPFLKDQRLWLLDFTKGTHSPLPEPEPGRSAVRSFDARGRPLVLTEQVFIPGTESALKLEVKDGERMLVLDGEHYQAAEEGMPGLAHALRFEDGAWRRIETKSASYEWEGQRGVEGLEAFNGNGTNDWGERLDAESPPPKGLRKWEQPTEEGAWRRLSTPGGPLYFWEADEGLSSTLMAPLLVESERGFLLPEGLEDLEGAIHLEQREELLLVRGSEGRHGRAVLWDTRSHKPVHAFTTNQVTFWPRPQASQDATAAPEQQ